MSAKVPLNDETVKTSNNEESMVVVYTDEISFKNHLKPEKFLKTLIEKTYRPNSLLCSLGKIYEKKSALKW